MIGRDAFRRYNLAAKSLADSAAAGVEREITAWCDANPDSTVAEKRECARRVMEAYAQTYDDAAASLAADFYDSAVGEDAGLDRAVTSAVYVPSKPDAVARYQAKKLATGGVRAFARACGEFAANDALRSLNATVIENAGRDREREVRFARVPTGAETCTFCMMLASRGARYHDRRTAGEFSHFHRRCDCKVVPGFADDPMEQIVEGCDPNAYYDLWKKFEEIDSTERPDGTARSKAEKTALKAAELFKAGGRPAPVDLDSLAWSKARFGKHAGKHCKEFGLDAADESDRLMYFNLTRDCIREYDAMATCEWAGQLDAICVVYAKDDSVAIINTMNSSFVSFMRFERGRNARLTAIWDSMHA